MPDGAAFPSGRAPGSIWRRVARRGVATAAPPAATIAALLAVWEGAQRAGWLPITVPAPSRIAGALGRSYGDLLFHMGPTVLAALTGLLLALVLALAAAALGSGVRALRPGILQLGMVVDSIPLIALTPILMLWLGNGLAARIAMATIAALFPLLVGASQGFAAVDRNVSDLFHVIAASRWQRLTKLAWPSALPFLFAAVKVAAPLALLGALIAEWVSADRGLGIMMTYALFSFNVPLAWLTIATVCALAAAAYGLVALAERWLLGPPPAAPGEPGHG
jgi:ABC-type nitrate/sulfonate/bicarbonate transport system permease component